MLDVPSKHKLPIIHVAIGFDEGYLTPAYVLLTSIFQNNPTNEIQIHTLAPEVRPAAQARLRDFVQQQGGALHFYELSKDVTQGFPVPDKSEAWLTLAAYYRLFFSRLLPAAIDKLLYIDIDTLVVGNLLDIYQPDMGNEAIGAVTEAEMPLRPDLGLSRHDEYFNSGVLLINLSAWKTQRITERALEVIKMYPERMEYCDQDALNMVCKGQWYRMNIRFNLMKAYIPHDLMRQAHQQFLADKVIIHFNGRIKPWYRICENKLRYLYVYYLRQSPQAHTKPYRKRTTTREEFTQLLRSRALEVYFNYPKIGQAWRRLKGGLT